LNAAFGDLVAASICPEILITAVIIYVFKSGVNEFCEPLDYKL